MSLRETNMIRLLRLVQAPFAFLFWVLEQQIAKMEDGHERRRRS
jgi:hypothetical protein